MTTIAAERIKELMNVMGEPDATGQYRICLNTVRFVDQSIFADEELFFQFYEKLTQELNLFLNHTKERAMQIFLEESN